MGAPSRRARKAFEPIARTTIIRASRRAPAPRDCEGFKPRAHQSRGKASAWLFDNLIAIASSARPTTPSSSGVIAAGLRGWAAQSATTALLKRLSRGSCKDADRREDFNQPGD
ncbi:hypothetical protein RPD_2666 [Rhodopseudomonas palustris BisB5]|uniref:Uncharacterized protein n=1 Tax=Rhodopseudomonas palustris (strain BisB5) TaxID=316057 RepID=Q136U4_RHOPS|nr:hypothetical protein RPD_2666 [Rhodopseudomonas palustris BisB5]